MPIDISNIDSLAPPFDFSVASQDDVDTIEKALWYLLTDHFGVSGFASTRVYPEIIPQNTTFPAVVYNLIAAPRSHHLTGMTDLVPARFQITAYADTYAEMRGISDEIRRALDSIQTTIGTVEIASSLMVDEVDLTERKPGTDKLTKRGRALDFRITYREV